MILLDEPFASIDVEVKAELRAEFRRVLRSLDTTAVHVTHDREEGFFLGTGVGLLFDGRLEAWGTPSEVYERPPGPRAGPVLGVQRAVESSRRCRRGAGRSEIDPSPSAAPRYTVVASGSVGRESVVVLRGASGERAELRALEPFARPPIGAQVALRWSGSGRSRPRSTPSQMRQEDGRCRAGMTAPDPLHASEIVPFGIDLRPGLSSRAGRRCRPGETGTPAADGSCHSRERGPSLRPGAGRPPRPRGPRERGAGRRSGRVPDHPERVLLQDFTGVPVLVDLATLRSAAVARGIPPQRVNPAVRVDLIVDHSVQVDSYGSPRSYLINLDREDERNHERYRFLQWAKTAYMNYHIVPPGNGICHQVNLEHLAEVVVRRGSDGDAVAYPDTLLGTDSHTTMVNGVSVLGWGVGGIEAEAVMLGEPYTLPRPIVVGVELTGVLPAGRDRHRPGTDSDPVCCGRPAWSTSS